MNNKPMEETSKEYLESAAILLVDDDEIYLFSASYAINQHYPGIKIITCRNGEEALERISQKSIKALFMDLDMPLMNGWELLAVLERKSYLKDIPIVVVSSTDDYQELEELNRHPLVHAHIQKPLTVDKLQSLNLTL